MAAQMAEQVDDPRTPNDQPTQSRREWGREGDDTTRGQLPT